MTKIQGIYGLLCTDCNAPLTLDVYKSFFGGQDVLWGRLKEDKEGKVCFQGVSLDLPEKEGVDPPSGLQGFYTCAKCSPCKKALLNVHLGTVCGA